MINKIDDIIGELLKSGSNILEYKEYISDNALKILENNYYEDFILKLNNFISDHLNKQTGIKNISIGIKIDNYELIINKGNVNFNESLYDIASITKMFTLKLCYDFEKLGLLDYNKTVKEIIPEFIYLDNYRIIDILKMRGFIQTDGKLSDTHSKEEMLERLKTVKVKYYDKSLYTDIGFNILPLILEKVYEEYSGLYLSFDELCKKYIFDVYKLKKTGFNLHNYNLIGNDGGILPSDEKAKLLNGVSGAAGIFTNLNDLFTLSKNLYSYKFFDRDFMKEILSYHFIDQLERKRSYAGIYLYTKNNRSSYATDYYSKNTIGHQGYTGSAFSIDLENKISHFILVDALNEYNKKEDKFFDFFHPLQDRISLDSIILYIVYKIKNGM